MSEKEAELWNEVGRLLEGDNFADAQEIIDDLRRVERFVVIEVVPLIKHEVLRLKGLIEFYYRGRKVLLGTSGTTSDVILQKSITGGGIRTEGYNTVELFIEVTDKEFESDFLPGKLIEEICDLMSISSGPLAFITPRVNEYLNYSWWSKQKKGKYAFSPSKIMAIDFNCEFISVNRLVKIINKIERSPYKENIISAIHLNRLAKFKITCHQTEALTDLVNSLEAIYMTEDKNTGYQSQIDKNLINNRRNKSKALEEFSQRYCPKRYLRKVNYEKIYEIRSAYLHRGKTIEGCNGFNWELSKEDKQTLLIIEKFCKVAYFALKGFIDNHK